MALLGEPYGPDPNLHAFPTAEQVAAADLELLAGRRFAWAIAAPTSCSSPKRSSAGERDLESLKDSALPRDELKKELKSIKGVGEYAANTLLMLLGYYGELALDSEMRSFVSKHYFDGGKLHLTKRFWRSMNAGANGSTWPTGLIRRLVNPNFSAVPVAHYGQYDANG